MLSDLLRYGGTGSSRPDSAVQVSTARMNGRKLPDGQVRHKGLMPLSVTRLVCVVALCQTATSACCFIVANSSAVMAPLSLSAESLAISSAAE